MPEPADQPEREPIEAKPDTPVKGPTVIVSGLVERDGQFLLVLCPRFKVWRAPGGRAEWGETVEQTLAREMGEELQVPITEPEFLGYGQDQQYHVRGQHETSRLILYFHTKIDQEPTLDPDEAEDSKMVSFVELRRHPNLEGALTDFLNRNPYLDL